MGFHKRIIHRDIIESNIKKLDFIINLTNADALVMDSWSSSFFDNLNFKWDDYQKKRQEIINETELHSNLSIIKQHKSFKSLKSISNIYFNLVNKPSWVDVLLLTSVLEIDIPNSKSGKFDELVNLCIKEINSKYDGY